MKLLNDWGYLYKITGLRLSQYPNTELSSNQHKYYRFQLRLGIKDWNLQNSASKC